MGIILLGAAIAALALAVAVVAQRRFELASQSRQLTSLAEAKAVGSHSARLQYPHIDLSRCIGCDACVRACPEDGVLGMIHGQASVIFGARCVGHGRCATACPVGAISLTLANIEARRDLPALSEHFEVLGSPGLYLAGEVTGYALIRTAILHGTAIIDRIVDQTKAGSRPLSPMPAGRPEDFLDVVIIGAGPAGIAATLRAKQRGLRYCTLEQEQLGGTVSKYPRRKLVMTQPVTLPLHGSLRKTTYTKEELVELWHGIARQHQLAIETGVQFTGLTRVDGGYQIATSGPTFRANNVCVAIGRRGTPVKLGVPGEELSKVAYGLVDAQSFRHRRILVVGGGDSAIEAALGLAEQPGNQVTLSYRRSAFSRLKARNDSALKKALLEQRLCCLLPSQVVAISNESVLLSVQDGEEMKSVELPNDDVFILAGGTPPYQLLETCGVSFDPQDRPAPPPLVDQGVGLLAALLVALFFATALLGWAWWFRSYYQAAPAARVFSAWHALLRPSGSVGMACGIAAVVLMLANLLYLARRSLLGSWLPGPLSAWMTAHVGTGILSLLLVLLHAGLAPKNTLGGHALAAMAVLIATGAIGRYFYSIVPRAANGKELELAEIDAIIAADLAKWDAVAGNFSQRVLEQIQQLTSFRWEHRGLVARLRGLLHSRQTARERLRELHKEGLDAGLSTSQLDQITALAARAYKAAVGSAYFEDLRAVLNSWRYLHRWIALLLVGLTIAHIALAIRYFMPRL